MKSRYNKTGAVVLLCTLLMTMQGCADPDMPGSSDGLGSGNAINIEGVMGKVTRANDTGFSDGDMMGIYIADYVDGKPGSLADDNLHAANVRYTYSFADGAWRGATTLYWNDKTTPIDVYGYYPFSSGISNPTAHPFTVLSRQDRAASVSDATVAAYEASDFLWAKAREVSPSSDIIRLTYTHAMAGVTIRLEAGSGFDANEFAGLTKNVWIESTVPDAVIDLEKQTVERGAGDAEKIYPFEYNGEYRAVVVPQTVDAGKTVIGITVDGYNYALKKDEKLNYLSGKMHTFTIRIDKKSGSGDYEVRLLPQTITAWLDDPEFHDGMMYQYVTVEVSEGGTLKQTIQAMGLKYDEITALKVCGPLNAEDREFIGREMVSCEALNVKDAVMTDGEFSIWTDCWMGGGHIRHVIYPGTPFKKLGNVGGCVFGNQYIPEGVEEINGWVTAKGVQVEFPSTLKRIGEMGGDLRGELKLPEGLESFWRIGGYFTGQLVLPQSLEIMGVITEGSFSGGLVVPQGVKEISVGSLERVKFTGTLELPDGLEYLPERAFGGCGFNGELVLPSSLKKIGAYCFAYNKFNKIIWPKNLATIDEGAFANNNRLEGTLEIPGKVVAIPLNAFRGCSLLTSIVLHEDVSYLGEMAFGECERITSIVCKSEVPPLICSNTFNGVNLGHVILEVPANAISAYRSAPGWKEFKNITPYSDFICRPYQVQALNKSKSYTLVLNADKAWRVTSKPDWCNVSPMSGTGKTSLNLTVNNLSSGNGNREGKVVFALEGTNITTSVEINQYDYKYGEDSAVVLQRHTKGNGIPIYFIGDGWNGQEISSGEYMTICRNDMEYFFDIAPYDRLRDYFDVYAFIPLSQESGINTVFTYRDTRFGSIYTSGAAGISCDGGSSELMPDIPVIREYLLREVTGISVSDYDLRRGLIIMVPNAMDYGSITYHTDECTVSLCPPTSNPYPLDNRGVVQHEAGGHGFGHLADELISKNAFAPNSLKADINSKHGMGWYMNVAATGNMNAVPWSHMIFNPKYSDRVDIFEGAAGYTRGIFRSEANSCMNLGIPYYNSISRQYITKRVLETAGEPFSLDDFYASDTFNWGGNRVDNGGGTRSGGRSGSNPTTRGANGAIVSMPNHHRPIFTTASENARNIKILRKKQSR